MRTSDIDQAALRRLTEHLAGAVIRPDDAGYDEARSVFNGLIDRRPALIVRCARTEDVVAAVGFARDSGLPLAVRSGGHSVVGLSVCDGGVVIDLGGLKRVDVDPRARLARTGGGVLWGEFDAATQRHGLHTPGGRVTTTGVGGFTTGGGYGWTSSRYGLACDNVVLAEVVTADGRVLTACEDEHPDLFWAIRGGGGNFGIVTRFDFALHELGPTVHAGMALWAIDRAPEVLRAWRDHVEEAPDEVSSACCVMTAPPEPFVPEQLRGRPVLALVGMHVGAPEAGAAAIRPLLERPPDADLFGPMPYTAFQAMLDPANPPGLRNYFRGDYLAALGDEAIDVYLTRAVEILSAAPLAELVIFRLGAGVARVADGASAFSHRDAPYLFHPILLWSDPAQDDAQIAAGRSFGEAMRAFGTGASYLNFTPDGDRVRAAYGEDTYRRLVAVKDAYDPGNLFRLNQNIAPSRRSGEPALA